MAQREPRKSTSKTDQGGLQGDVRRLTARAAALEQECEALKAELELARAQIAELERRREQAADRMAWVIDSLQTLMEQRA